MPESSMHNPSKARVRALTIAIAAPLPILLWCVLATTSRYAADGFDHWLIVFLWNILLLQWCQDYPLRHWAVSSRKGRAAFGLSGVLLLWTCHMVSVYLFGSADKTVVRIGLIGISGLLVMAAVLVLVRRTPSQRGSVGGESDD